MLVEAGADAGAVDENDNSAMSLAEENEATELVELLESLGAKF